jgi:hypothetical protein
METQGEAMRIIDPVLLSRFSGAGYCEICHEWCRRREPHHVMRRGVGGGSRLDHRLNLLAVGSAWCCGCHNAIHEGRISRERQISVVALRERLHPSEVQNELYRLIRLPKEAIP